MISETTPLLEALEKKFDAINQKTETHLEGLLWSKPITYWDYIQTDALLNLQTQRTVLIIVQNDFVGNQTNMSCCPTFHHNVYR